MSIYIYIYIERERFIYIQGLIAALDNKAAPRESAGWKDITAQLYEVKDNKEATQPHPDAKVFLQASLIPHFKMLAKENTDANKETLEL